MLTSCVWEPRGAWFLVGTTDSSQSLWQEDPEDMHFAWLTSGTTNDIAMTPDGHRVIATGRACLYVYNAMTRELEYEHKTRFGVTSVSASQDSKHLLILQSNGDLNLLDHPAHRTVQTYIGSTGREFSIIKSAFGGPNEIFVLSASEGEEVAELVQSLETNSDCKKMAVS